MEAGSAPGAFFQTPALDNTDSDADLNVLKLDPIGDKKITYLTFTPDDSFWGNSMCFLCTQEKF